MGEVLPFKNIGMFLEEAVTFAGSHRGSVTLAYKVDQSTGNEIWFGVVAFIKDDQEIKKTFTNGSFNDTVLEISRFVKNAA